MKKIIAALILFAAVVFAFGVKADAADIVASGYCGGEGDGTNLTWTLDSDGALTISGEGAMADYSSSSSRSPWYSNRNSIIKLEIEDGCTTIGAYALSSCTNLTSVAIPESVTSIGSSAFSGCTNLANITIPDNITVINGSTFSSCSSLTSITIPEGVTSIEGRAFSSCINLQSINIPESVSEIGNFAFDNLTNLKTLYYNAKSVPDFTAQFPRFDKIGSNGSGTTVVFGDSVEKIPAYCFYTQIADNNQNNVTTISIGESVTTIGICAFYNLTKVTRIDYNTKYSPSIGSNAFNNIGKSGTGIKVVFGDVVDTVPDNLFRNGNPKIREVIIGSNVNTIGAYAFSDCTTLTSLSLSDSVTSIGNHAFYNCRILGDIVFPEGITTIHPYTFYGCSLGMITFSNNLTSIGGYAFYGCNGISGGVVIPNGVTSIGEYAFYNCSRINALSLPGSINSLGKYAFYGCSSITGNVVIPEGITYLPVYLFYNCSSIKTITIPESLTEIGEYALYGLTRLTQINYNARSISDRTSGSKVFWNAGNSGDGIRVVFGDTVESIPAYLFYTGYEEYVPNLKSIVIGANVNYIGHHAFYDCKNLSGSVFIPEGVTVIGERTFYNCSSMEGLTLPESLTSIGADAFYNCRSLTELYYNSKNISYIAIPDYLSGVFYNAGSSGSGLTVTIGETVERIPANLFRVGGSYLNPDTGFPNVVQLVIGTNVESIGDYAFPNLKNLSKIDYKAKNVSELTSGGIVFTSSGSSNGGFNVIFSDTVEIIPEHLFDDCGIKNVVFGCNIYKIGQYAFNNCSRLTGTIVIPEGVTCIEPYTFYNCTSLQSITIHNSVTRIGEYAFYGCRSLSGSVIIPEGITTLERYTFYDCVSIESLTLPEGLTRINEKALYNLSGLNEINYNAKSIQDFTYPSSNDGVFYNAGGSGSGIDVVFGNTVDSIPAYLFYVYYNGSISNPVDRRPKLNSISIPNNVYSIGENAFSGCISLAEINYDAGEVTIGSGAFNSVGTGSSGIVFSIGANAEQIPTLLLDLNRLAWFDVDDDNSNYRSDFGILYNKTGKICIKCPKLLSGSVELLDVTRVIEENAFSGCNIVSIVFPNTLSTICANAFSGCVSLTSITLPEGLSTVGAEAFSNCTGLVSVQYKANSLSDFSGTDVFYNAGIEGEGINVSFDDSVRSIPDYMFKVSDSRYRPKVSNIEFGDSITSIGSYAFYGCLTIKELVFPDSLTRIGAYAFSNNSNLEALTIGENVTSIEDAAFSHCSSLSTIHYNAKLVYDLSYGSSIFYSSGSYYNNTFITIGEKVEKIPAYLFANSSFGYIAVKFYCDYPLMGDYCFNNKHITGYYPYGNPTWNDRPSLIGGCSSLFWVAFSMEPPASISISSLPQKTVYQRGDEIDLSGLQFSITHVDGCTDYDHTVDEIDGCTYDLSILGRRPVTVYCQGAEATFFVTVVEYIETLIDSSLYPESPHDYYNNMNETYTYSYPGAVKIEFTFSDETEVEEQMDYLYVYDSNGNLVATYTKKEAAGQTIIIDGDSFSIGLESDDSATYYGFSLNSIVVTTALGSCKVGHTFGDSIEYLWAFDYSYVTAGHLCVYCGESDKIENVRTTCVTTATCTEPGEKTYTAIFTDPVLETQTKTIYDPAFGHRPQWWPDFYWDWSTWNYDDPYSMVVTASRRCSQCDYIESKQAEIISVVEGTGEGYSSVLVITAFVEFDENSYSDTNYTTKRFSISFDTAGGSPMPSVNVYYGESVNNWLGEPTRPGYKFAGWTLNGEPYDLYGTPVYSDITLVATWTVDDSIVTLRSAYLSLEGKISINFKVQAPDAGYVAMLYYEKAGFEQVAEVPLNSEHFVSDPSNYDYYLVTYSEVPAKEMTQQLRIKVFDSNGNQVPMKISSGFIDQYDYSVAKWCTNMINKNTNANDVMIAKALLNYGHYSQLALKYNDGRENRPDNMPAAWLESEMGSVTANSAYDRITDGGKALGAKSFILVLESDTLIKLVLSRPVNVSIDDAPVTLAPETDSSGNAIWAAYSSGVAAKRLHERKALTLTEGSNSATLYYGVLSWANSKLANGNEDDQNLARAMYLYNAAARRYFHYDEAGLQ